MTRPTLRLDADGWPSAAVAAPSAPPRQGDEQGDGTVASRRCGRCLAMFPGDPGLDPVGLQDWWLCPPCRLALLGPRAGTRPTQTGPHHGR